MKPLPMIGFDRFLARSWLDLTLAIAAGERSPAELHAVLEQAIQGRDARSKTLTLLNRLWLNPHPTVIAFARDGVALYQSDLRSDPLPLHWGMALRSHPFFAAIADSIGRLLRLHGEFSSAQVARRLKEHYGDRATVLRAAEAVLQTLASWNSISRVDSKQRLFRTGPAQPIQHKEWALWLTEAGIASLGRSAPLNAPLNALFPWMLEPLSERDLEVQSRMGLIRMGGGEVLIGLR